MVSDYEAIKHIEWFLEKKVWLYGASKFGKDIFDLVDGSGVNVVGFLDSNSKLHGKLIKGLPVMSLDDVCNNDEVLIVVASSWYQEIIKMIEQREDFTGMVVTAIALKWSLYCNSAYVGLHPDWRRRFLNKIVLERSIASCDMKTRIFKQWERVWDNNRVWIYQSGRVGSLAIRNALDEYGIKNAHIHTMAYFKECMSEEETVCFNDLMREISNKTIKVITLVREPIARDISYFMHLLHSPEDVLYCTATSNDMAENCRNMLDTWCVESMDEEMLQRIKEDTAGLLHKRRLCGSGGGIFSWFQSEIEAVFHVDIFQYPFDREKGYSFIKQGNVELLILKNEKLSDLTSVIGEFVGCSDFALTKKRNATNEYMTHYLYNEILQNVKISERYFNMYYDDNRFLEHFYTEGEIQGFKEKWSRHIK